MNLMNSCNGSVCYDNNTINIVQIIIIFYIVIVIFICYFTYYFSTAAKQLKTTLCFKKVHPFGFHYN